MSTKCYEVDCYVNYKIFSGEKFQHLDLINFDVISWKIII